MTVRRLPPRPDAGTRPPDRRRRDAPGRVRAADPAACPPGRRYGERGGGVPDRRACSSGAVGCRAHHRSAAAREPVVASLLAVAAMTVLTGALHLDGLADTADALARPRPDERRASAQGSVGRARRRGRPDPGARDRGRGAGEPRDVRRPGDRGRGAGDGGGRRPDAAGGGRPRWSATGRRASGFGGWFAARVRPADAVVAVVLAVLVTAALALVARVAGRGHRRPAGGGGRAGHGRLRSSAAGGSSTATGWARSSS